MGGYGSGGWTGRPTTADAKPLDVNRMNRAGYLKPGTRSQQSWTRGDEPSGSIGTEANENGITLIYKTRSHGGEWQDVREYIVVTWEPCHFGGQRPYFYCPACRQRIVKLYGLARFLCRSCNRLAYQCQRETAIDRILRRDWKLRARIGGEPGIASLIPRRPKGMHKRTYNQIIDEINRTESIVTTYTWQRWGMAF